MEIYLKKKKVSHFGFYLTLSNSEWIQAKKQWLDQKASNHLYLNFSSQQN